MVLVVFAMSLLIIAVTTALVFIPKRVAIYQDCLIVYGSSAPGVFLFRQLRLISLENERFDGETYSVIRGFADSHRAVFQVFWNPESSVEDLELLLSKSQVEFVDYRRRLLA